MARIAGVNLPLNKRSEVGLTYIYGIGRSTSNKILEQVGVSPDTYVRDLTEDEVSKLRDAIDSGLTVEGDLRRERSQDIKRLQEIGCYRGLRHRRGLPVRGQNTKTNARTRKGPILEEGMVLAVEPMMTAGSAEVRVDEDGWAIFSRDRSLAAHFEFTVAITGAGPRVLTPWRDPALMRAPERAAEGAASVT